MSPLPFLRSKRSFRARALRRSRPRCEPLEDRTTPSIYVVDQLGDAGAGTGDRGDLRYCVNQANLNPGSDTIQFDAAVFGAAQTIPLASELILSDTVGTTVIESPASGLVTVSGGGSVRVLQILSGVTAELRSLTITEGRHTKGAGIYNSGTLSVVSCNITGNNASHSTTTADAHASGGGIYSDHGALTVTDSILSGNRAQANSSLNDGYAYGGGIFVDGGAMTLTGSTLLGNGAVSDGLEAAHAKGGGLYIETGSTAAVTGSQVVGNLAQGYWDETRGGGIYSGGLLTVRDSTISGNLAHTSVSFGYTSAGGGGIANGASGTMKLISSTVVGNRVLALSALHEAVAEGGGLLCGGGGNTVVNSTVSGNTVESTSGPFAGLGGVYASAAQGGGIYAGSTGVWIRNSTVVGNSVDGSSLSVFAPRIQGGGLYGWNANTQLANSIVAGNTSTGTGRDVYGGRPDSGPISLGYNLVQHWTNRPGYSQGDLPGGTDPLLGPLADNGGPTHTYAPLPGSPVIDHGYNDNIPIDPATGLPFATDQRGERRISNGQVEIGAVEVDVAIPIADAGGPYTVDEGGSVLLTGSGSDPDGIGWYEWDLDLDGVYDTGGGNPNHVFSATLLDGPMERTVRLRVMDYLGDTATDLAVITVQNVAPAVSAGSDVILDGWSFSRAGSFTDASIDTWTATVDYGDGTGAQELVLTGQTFTLDHTYAGPGRYTVTVQVSDDDGGAGAAVFVVTLPAFRNIAAGLPGVSNSSAAWGDYDRDGDLDILLTGSRSGNRVAEVWRNNGDGTFADVGAGLTGVQYGSTAWGDYDRDGDLDILLTGESAAGRVAQVWRNDGGGAFTEIGAGLTGVRHGSAAWGDYDADGDLDILLTGESAAGYTAQVWRNNGDGAFADIHAGLREMAYSSAVWGDYDGDGNLDILLTGEIPGQPWTELSRNNGDGTFSTSYIVYPGVSNSSAAWGDYDGDGDLDMLIAGWAGDQSVAQVWRNDGGSFADIGAGLTGVQFGSVAWGDYDGDGDLDVLVTGGSTAGLEPICQVWRNNGDGTFADTGAGLPGVRNGSAVWGDYDGDGDLDILLAGSTIAQVWANRDTTPNTAPAAPSGLTGTALSPTSARLSWAAPADDTTPTAALNYVLRVGTTPDGCDVVSPMALPTGARTVARLGPVQGTAWTLTGLDPTATYYWSVQAIDAAFAGSSFAAEGSFRTDTVPVAVAGGPYAVPEGGGVTLDASGSSDPDPGDAIVAYAWDLDGDGAFDDAVGAAPVVSWATLVSLGYGVPTSRTIGLQVTDGFGATDTASVVLAVTDVTPVLAVEKTGPGVIRSGETATFTITIRNDSPASTDPVAITAIADSHLGDLLSAAQAQNNGNPIELQPGQSFAFSVTSSPLTAGTVTGVVTVAGRDNEGSPASAQDGHALTVEPRPSSVWGFVYVDRNNNGRKGPREPGIRGVRVRLAGVDDRGQAVSRSTRTRANGSYVFSGLRPGTYVVRHFHPSGYLPGKNTIGSQGGTLFGRQFLITLVEGVTGLNNNFGERWPWGRRLFV